MWKLWARANGWREAFDVEDNALVVWHPDLCVHYTGSDAWKWAACHREGLDRDDLAAQRSLADLEQARRDAR
jgi:hypothetical protein